MKRLLIALLISAWLTPAMLLAEPVKLTGKKHYRVQGKIYPITILPKFSISTPTNKMAGSQFEDAPDVLVESTDRNNSFPLTTTVEIVDNEYVYTVIAL